MKSDGKRRKDDTVYHGSSGGVVRRRMMDTRREEVEKMVRRNRGKGDGEKMGIVESCPKDSFGGMME